MHGYEIQQILQSSHIDLWTNIQTNSIYHALRQMEKEGLIEEFSKEAAGKRVRVVYTITEQGKAEYLSTLKTTLQQPTKNVPSNLYASLSFLKDLSFTKSIDLITEHIQELENIVSKWQKGIGISKGFDRSSLEASIYDVTLLNGIEHMKLDIKMLTSVIEILKERK